LPASAIALGGGSGGSAPGCGGGIAGARLSRRSVLCLGGAPRTGTGGKPIPLSLTLGGGLNEGSRAVSGGPLGG
jgi:hypothetical protein